MDLPATGRSSPNARPSDVDELEHGAGNRALGRDHPGGGREVRPIFVDEPDEIVVVTVSVYYF